MSKASQGIFTGLLVTLVLTGSTLANAQPPRPVAARPMVARPMAVRPHPGPGINQQEAARIRHQVQEHRRMQRRANADGALSRHEQAVLARDAAQVRKLIQTASTN